MALTLTATGYLLIMLSAGVALNGVDSYTALLGGAGIAAGGGLVALGVGAGAANHPAVDGAIHATRRRLVFLAVLMVSCSTSSVVAVPAADPAQSFGMFMLVLVAAGAVFAAFLGRA